MMKMGVKRMERELEKEKEVVKSKSLGPFSIACRLLCTTWDLIAFSLGQQSVYSPTRLPFIRWGGGEKGGWLSRPNCRL